MTKNLAETLPELHTEMFGGKKLVKAVGRDPYIRYYFEDGGYFEQYLLLGELNWIKVEDGLPPNSPVGPHTDLVLIHTNREYQPTITTASGEYTEDGFVWFPDSPRVLEPVYGGKPTPRVTEWAVISLPINHEGKESS